MESKERQTSNISSRQHDAPHSFSPGAPRQICPARRGQSGQPLLPQMPRAVELQLLRAVEVQLLEMPWAVELQPNPRPHPPTLRAPSCRPSTGHNTLRRPAHAHRRGQASPATHRHASPRSVHCLPAGSGGRRARSPCSPPGSGRAARTRCLRQAAARQPPAWSALDHPASPCLAGAQDAPLLTVAGGATARCVPQPVNRAETGGNECACRHFGHIFLVPKRGGRHLGTQFRQKKCPNP